MPRSAPLERRHPGAPPAAPSPPPRKPPCPPAHHARRADRRRSTSSSAARASSMSRKSRVVVPSADFNSRTSAVPSGDCAVPIHATGLSVVRGARGADATPPCAVSQLQFLRAARGRCPAAPDWRRRSADPEPAATDAAEVATATAAAEVAATAAKAPPRPKPPTAAVVLVPDLVAVQHFDAIDAGPTRTESQ